MLSSNYIPTLDYFFSQSCLRVTHDIPIIMSDEDHKKEERKKEEIVLLHQRPINRCRRIVSVREIQSLQDIWISNLVVTDLFITLKSVRFRGPKSKKRHGGAVLHKHERVRTKERKAERRQNFGTGEPCHVARSCHLGTVWPCHMLLCWTRWRRLGFVALCNFFWRLGFISKGKTLVF